tara:strand:- start:756 stop:992 length:237 start_codon:yes stop_codon:yes gene_type:complete
MALTLISILSHDCIRGIISFNPGLRTPEYLPKVNRTPLSYCLITLRLANIIETTTTINGMLMLGKSGILEKDNAELLI